MVGGGDGFPESEGSSGRAEEPARKDRRKAGIGGAERGEALSEALSAGGIERGEECMHIKGLLGGRE